MEKFSEQEVLQQMQACQLDILKAFKKVCDANNLRFYLAFGTCLGAIRHHGRSKGRYVTEEGHMRVGYSFR